MSNGNYVSNAAVVASAVAIVTLPSIQKIWDDTFNIVKGKSEEGILTCQCCWFGTTYLYFNSMEALTHVDKF